MKLYYLSSEAIDDIKANFDEYKPHFKDNTNEWFISKFKEEDWLHESKLECEDFTFDTDPDYNISDRKNIEIVYDAMKDLKASNAMDERLWAGLLFYNCWDYVKYRRKKELESGDKKDILNSFMFMNGTKRSCFVNCLSRLWWTGYLLFDKDSSNHYWAADLICTNAYASNIVLFSSSNFTSNKEICFGILDCFSELHKKGIDIVRKHIVEANRCLNKKGGVILLDTLTRSDVNGLVGAQLM